MNTAISKNNINDSIEDYLLEVPIDHSFCQGLLVRRIGNNKDQQGLYKGYSDNGHIILGDVIDNKAGNYVAETGEMRLNNQDRLFIFRWDFNNSENSSRAIIFLTTWTLFKKYRDFQVEMIEFVKTLFSPEQIIELNKSDMLRNLFVPLQQKFKIGRYTEEIDWTKIAIDGFWKKLKDLKKGDHLTYLVHIPEDKFKRPVFYSAGTEPHRVTHKMLDEEKFAFNPTNGGYIKMVSLKNGIKTFVVDAGSNYIGRGVKTQLKTSEKVVKMLYKLYNGHIFIPL